MKLVDRSIRYPVSVAVAVILAVLFGFIGLVRLPVQMIPTIDRPEISVETRYPGAGPLEVEEEITRRQEELLNTVENLRKMTSISEEGRSRIVLQYDWSTNKDVARIDVSEKLAAVRGLPDDTDEPFVRAVNSDEQTPVAWIILLAREDLNDVRRVAEDVVKAQLERVPGVGQVWFFGGQEREVHIELSFAAMAARGITLAQVESALRQENLNLKAGGFDEGKRRYGVRTEGRFRELPEVEATIVGRDALGPIRVRDVANVRYGHQERLFTVHQNGQPALIFGVLRKTGSNTLEVVQGVHEVVRRLNGRFADRGVEIRIVYDATVYIDEAIALVTTNLLIGACFATLVLLLFLRSRSAVLVLGLSIPISVITTFLFLWLFGRSLNIISLAGLTFATGMVLDNAIVVLENIFRQRELGKGMVRAAYDGTVEVWGAILASTLTTLAVFIPIVLVEEAAGQIFRDIAIAISIAIALSLIVSITVIPMLSARLLRTPPRTVGASGFGGRAVERILDLLRWLLASPGRKGAMIAAIILVAISAALILRPDLDYLPEGNRNMIFVTVRTPPGYNLRQNERIVRLIEERILSQPEVHRMFAVVRHDFPIMGVVLKPEHKDKRSIRSFMDRLRELTLDVPGKEAIYLNQIPLIRRGRASSGNLEVLLQGDDLGQIQRVSEALVSRVEKIDGVRFVNPSLEVGKPEFVVEVDRVRAAELGLTVAQVGTLVEALVDGVNVGTFDDAGKDIDLVLRAPEGSIDSVDDLARAVMHTPTGQTVQLGDVARIESRLGPTRIEHTDLDRSVKISVGLDPEIALGDAITRVEEAIDPLRSTLPLGYSIELTGQADDLDRIIDTLLRVFPLALFITYLLLASLFESFWIPLVILVSVPFATSGGVIALRALQALDSTVKLDTITMFGFVILIGVVVNNAILLVHQTLNRLREGQAPEAAIVEGVRSRIRPIFMTMVTTVFGMSPLVLAGGSGSELYRGLGATLIGGMVLATVFTLILVPAVLSFFLSEQPVEGRASAPSV
ncbi:MAG: efflux RND transporter permease subunit [Myxococcota bacterium]